MSTEDLTMTEASIPEVPTVPEVPSIVAAEPQAAPARPATPDAGGFVWGTGRRKTSVARVRVKAGTGVIKVNDREVDVYFTEPQHQAACRAPIEATNAKGLDVFVKVHGGGITGQAGAVLLGVARALKGYDPSFEAVLRERNYLTRDPREVERKKYGQAGARRRFQFSKR